MGRTTAETVTKQANNVFKNQSKAPESISESLNAVASENPKAAGTTIPDVRKFHHTKKALYLAKLCLDMKINTLL